VDLNHRLLGYESKTISFFNLQDAGAPEEPCKKR